MLDFLMVGHARHVALDGYARSEHHACGVGANGIHVLGIPQSFVQSFPLLKVAWRLHLVRSVGDAKLLTQNI